jgi:hypothetical protein
MKWIIENVPKTVGVLSFLGLILTTVHDWGYFSVVGSKFRSIQTTYDYITNAIEWLPALILILIFSMLASFTIVLATVPSTPEFGFDDLRVRFTRRRLRNQCISFVILGALAYLASWFLTFPYNRVLSISSASAIVMSAGMFLDSATAGNKNSQNTVRGTAFIAGFLALTFLYGVLDAASAIRSTENVYRITYKNSNFKNAPLLRSFEKGILIWNLEVRTAEFIRWDEISGVSHVVATDQITAACRLLPRFCTTPTEP